MINRLMSITLFLIWALAACVRGTPVPSTPVAETEAPTGAASSPYEAPLTGAAATPYAPPPADVRTLTETPAVPQTYIDPAGQFSFEVPTGWQPGGEEGVFTGTEGRLQAGYLPEMAFMDRVWRVCERLANTPQGPGRKIVLYPFSEADACLLEPYPEMSIDVVKLVVTNPAGKPEQRYFFIEMDRSHFDEIAASMHLVNHTEPSPYPAGQLRPEDEAFWSQSRSQPDDLTVEEYAVVAASADSPTHMEFNERIPAEVLEKRAAWRGYSPESQLASNNSLLEPFGYALRAKEESETQLYELYRGEQLLTGGISQFWPVSVSASGSDFALALTTLDSGDRLVRKDRLEEWDMSASLFFPPVFSDEELLTVRWDSERGQVQVVKGKEQVFAFASLYLVDMPVKGLWSWQGHWLLEVDGFLIQDGAILNEQLGYDEIFGWQLLNEKPFYYFRRGPRVGISYDGQVLPVAYDDIPHYRCCEYAAFNPAGNEDMVWFYGLRDEMWHYVEMGVYAE